MTAAMDPQQVPVKMYQSADGDRLTVAAPMPGLQPGDISVEVTPEGGLTLHAELRGTLKGENDVMMDEWNPGPYHRELDLSVAVNAEQGNVTYNNGVLVVVLPVEERVTPAKLRLDPVEGARDARVGNTGHPLTATTTEENQRAQEATVAQAGSTSAHDRRGDRPR